MSINKLLKEEMFETYKLISLSINEIQRSEKPLEDKKSLMKELRHQYENTLTEYNGIASSFANSFMEHYKLTDHVITARIGSPTHYGNQPKDYLWSGISIDKDKSFSFQYSWVFQKDELEVTFCFGSGGSSSGNIEEKKKLEKESNMRTMENRFLEILSNSTHRDIVERMLSHEGFVLTAEWLNAKEGQEISSIDNYIDRVRKKTGAKSGITRYFKKDELLSDGFNLEEKIYSYFELFRPIWDQMHLSNTDSHYNDLKIAESKTIAFVEEYTSMNDIEIKPAVAAIQTYIQQRGFTYPELLIENFYLSLKTKPFVILAGISGTGKTKLVKLFAEALGATDSNHQFTFIPVRPDWSDPSDLLGYKDLSGTFRAGKLTEVLLEASRTENRNKPYFVCLDEMNLARVEHYFSDMLSILETQKWKDGRIITDAAIFKDTLNTSDYGAFVEDLGIPSNVFLIGTVNMDETTHPFSKKVLDRANTLEFNYVKLDEYPSINGDIELVDQAALPYTFLSSDYLQLQDAFAEYADLIKRTTDKLVKINTILEENHSHIGFRVRDAVSFYMIYNQRFGLMEEQQAFDLQLLQKILPRVQGSSSSVKRVLVELMLFCLGRQGKVEDLMNDPSELYKPWKTSSSSSPIAVYPQSARKLAYMLRRLEEDGFTSFWLS
ncbi:AAA family ATPase [Paenibacillus sp. WQ 127069]|uniref:AAA family ATPase n=1 Tax=Paenibacillus baimaensis TaxID=2982185 RepID=A0ABT2UCV2_9BACL|nr:AAA family ATPase [Paenibacillus sp. WQ 127069]MCU6792468.1 AAA family ATPase [Paenibacillus sp. WQ 127069]